MTTDWVDTLEETALSAEEISLMRMLRSEAEGVKDCFTKFSFQAWIFATVALGVILEFQDSNKSITLFAIPVILILLHVNRIGLHKYTTANRLYGYELFIGRRRRLQETDRSWRFAMARIGWEEASYAWRVIQPTIFSTYYRSDEGPQWFGKEDLALIEARQSVLIGAEFISKSQDIDVQSTTGPRKIKTKPINYYPGSYLEKSLLVTKYYCYLLCLTFWVPLIGELITHYLAQSTSPTEYWFYYKFLTLENTVIISSGFLMFSIVYLRYQRLNSKRELLESGIHSINSCSFIWKIVIVAHYRALQQIVNEKSSSGSSGFYDYQGYSENLARQAMEIRAHVIADPVDGLSSWLGLPVRSEYLKMSS